MDGRGNGSVRGRRQFTVEMAAALLGGAAVTIGCGGGASPQGPSPFVPPSPASPPATPAPPSIGTGAVGNNHGHEAVITSAQLLAGGALRLDITGGAPHPHTVELSAQDVVRIRGGEKLTVDSSEDVGLFGPHRHSIQFT